MNFSCLDCDGEDTNLAFGVAAAVIVAFLLAALLLLRHMGRSSGPRGLVERTVNSVMGMVTKALPLTAIKIVVVVWQIIFQV